MKLLAYILLIYLGYILGPCHLYAQEEESAEVSLEENTDAFQENFFEALKQQGIENYDKAINHLLECKRLEPANAVVDYQLARAYLANSQPVQALEHSTTALTAEPANLWYLEILVSAALQQGHTLERIKEVVPYAKAEVKENLARVFYAKNDLRNALRVLEELKASPFSNQLIASIRDSLEQKDAEIVEGAPDRNPLESLRIELQELLARQDYAVLDGASLEAVETYPSYPFFYYVRGVVLNHRGLYKEAAATLEEGLNYLLDDPPLEDEMYRALVVAFTQLGNSEKAALYRGKIKSGS